MRLRNDVLLGRRALVTGASSGLGADFARELAGRGCHLVLVARRVDRLSSLRQELAAHGVGIDVIGMDLAAAEAPLTLYRRVQDLGEPVDVLINNAGYAIWGEFLATPWERERNMLELDVLTLVGLTKLFLGDMVARGFGFVLQVAPSGPISRRPPTRPTPPPRPLSSISAKPSTTSCGGQGCGAPCSRQGPPPPSSSVWRARTGRSTTGSS